MPDSQLNQQFRIRTQLTKGMIRYYRLVGFYLKRSWCDCYFLERKNTYDR
jgi:hypothetical protein